jgi:p-hydroxybenzoate 3-monooxygenase
VVDDPPAAHLPRRRGFPRASRRAELDYLVNSQAAMAALAENYVGLPYEWGAGFTV